MTQIQITSKQLSLAFHAVNHNIIQNDHAKVAIPPTKFPLDGYYAPAELVFRREDNGAWVLITPIEVVSDAR